MRASNTSRWRRPSRPACRKSFVHRARPILRDVGLARRRPWRFNETREIEHV
jgi:hypothetical protein